MKLDLSIQRGRIEKPVVIFIHGLGVDKRIMVDPCEAKIFANNVPLKFLAARRPKSRSLQDHKKLTIGDIPVTINNLWNALRDKEYNLLCWSQRRPVGPISAAVEELGEVMTITKQTFPCNAIAFIGHSRGGLIARKFMENNCPEIKALITISTPHSGSSLAHLGKYIKPLSSALKVVLPKDARGPASEILKRFNELIEGNATRELLPGSDFLISMKDSPFSGIRYLSFGGTKTQLLTVYRWEQHDDKLFPVPFVTIPNSLLKVFPASVLPDELTAGKGDFMVSSKSAVLPWAEQHYNIPANHISILWNKKMIGKTVELLQKL